MSVGLPGTGLGAAFYLLSALWAPVRARLRGEGRSRGIGVAAIALGIIAAVALSMYAIALAMPEARVQVVSIDTEVDASSPLPLSLILALLLGPLGTLALLLGAVRIGAWLVHRGSDDEGAPIADAEPIPISDLDEQLEVAQ